MKKSVSGFTIVELLIVIVVIAILAAISVVAYTGIQQRARNAQTVSAVNAYVKALSLYKVDHGEYPPVSSCLGIGYEDGACEVDTPSGLGMQYEDNEGLNTTYLAPYLGSSTPTPNTVLTDVNSTLRVAGAIYDGNLPPFIGGGRAAINIYLLGTGDCPAVSGLTETSSEDFSSNSGRVCRYLTGQ